MARVPKGFPTLTEVQKEVDDMLLANGLTNTPKHRVICLEFAKEYMTNLLPNGLAKADLIIALSSEIFRLKLSLA